MEVGAVHVVNSTQEPSEPREAVDTVHSHASSGKAVSVCHQWQADATARKTSPSTVYQHLPQAFTSSCHVGPAMYRQPYSYIVR